MTDKSENVLALVAGQITRGGEPLANDVCSTTEILAELTIRSLAELVAVWLEYRLLNYEAYVREALEMVLQHRPQHSGTVSGVLESWASAERELVDMVKDHAASLPETASVPPHVATGQDFPLMGDLRSRHGKLQVWLGEDGWFWLGDEVREEVTREAWLARFNEHYDASREYGAAKGEADAWAHALTTKELGEEPSSWLSKPRGAV